MPTPEEIRAELARRGAMPQPSPAANASGVSADAIRAELARRASQPNVAPMGGTGEFDPKAFAGLNVVQPKPLHDGNDAINAGIEEAAALVPGGYANFQKQGPDPARMQAMGYVQDPLAKGGYAKPAAPQEPVVNNPSANNLFTDAARFLEAPVRGLTGGGLEGWARTTSEDPLLGANEAVDFISPIDDAGRAYQGLKQAGAGAIDGDWQRAGEGLKQAFIDGSFTAMQVLPGSMTLKGITAPGRAATATAQTLADAERAAVAASRAGPVPKASKPPPAPANAFAKPAPFSAPATPVSGNIIARNADRIVTGGIGATIGGAADAFAAPGDGGGDGEGGPPIGAGIGAGIGIFGPRAVASAASRGFRAAARPFRPVGFDERVAARAVRNALKSGGITTPEQAAAAMTARFGEKPASVADLTQEGVGTAAGLSRLPGATGEAARARGEDLLQNRAGRLEGDIAQANPSLNPAAIAGDVDRMVQLAQSQAKPAYDGLRARYPLGSIVSDRLEQLRGLDILAPHIRGVDRYRETLAATEGRVVGDFEYWDLVKRSLDDTEQAAVARNQPVPYDLDSTRQAIVQEMDRIVPDYPAARELGGEAPKMRDAFKQGQALLGGRYTAEDVSRLIQGITGQQLTAAQAGVIRSMVAKTEGARGAMASLMSTGARRKLAQVFGPEAADAMQARFAADAAIVNNAQRINPNVGSVTSQAQLGGGIGPMVADAIRAVRSPAEAALAALSRSGSYSQAQRDLMGQMLLDGVTPENLERIFRSRTPRGPRPAPGGPAVPPTGGGAGPAGGVPRPRGPRPAPSEEAVLSAMAQVNQLAPGRPAPRGPMGPPVREAMWNGPIPSKPQSLLAWIRSQGGINDTNYMTGDLTAIMGRANGMPGLLNRQSGQGLDDLAAAAYHQGFDVNPDDANSLVRLIEEEFGGNPNYRLGAKEEWDAYQETLRARRRPLPGETSNASPAVTGALIGGTAGYVASDGDPTATLAGAGLGGLAGNRLAKFGGGRKPPTPPKPPVPKAPVAGGPVATKDRAVWEMRGAGLSNAEIARRADTTESMVDVHYRKAERALGAPPSDPSVLSKYPEKAPTQAAATVSTAEPFTSKAGNATLNYEERPFWWADDSLDVSMDYVPEKPPTLSETKDLFTQMYDRMKAKMQAEGRSVYSANGDTPSKRKLYDSAVKALPPPDGYTPMKSPGSDMILFVRNDMVGKLPEGAPKDLAPISSVTPLKPAPKPPTRQGMGSSKLPMDEGARLARAREQGFDVEFPVYHGSRSGGGFDEFQKSERGRFGPGVYFSEQPGVAGKYGEAKPYVVPTTDQLFDAMPRWNSLTPDAEQRIINQLRPQEKEKLLAQKNWYKREGEAFWEALRRSVDGEDGVLADARASEVIQAAGFKGIRGIGDGQETVIFDPKNVRSKDAKFDPAESSSSKLLAGLGGPSGAGAAGGGILGGVFARDANGDGTVDAQERANGALGGAVSLGIGGGIAGKALGSRAAGKFGNRLKGPPRSRVDAQTFGGVNAKTADRAALGRAQNMEAEGADRNAIWDATGWFKGVDGKWRFEIDDSGAKLTGRKAGQLSQVMDHPELYNAYPDLPFAKAVRGGAGGDYIAGSGFNDETIRIGHSGNNARSVALHEAGGHGVQSREDFAMGGSPRSARSEVEMMDAADRMRKDADVAMFAKLHAELGDVRAAQDAMAQMVEPRYRAMSARSDWEYAGSPSVEKADMQAQYSAQQMRNLDTTDKEAYRRLAGEVDARNIQTRDEMRRKGKTPGRPWETQDVPDDQQIVRFGSGKAESRPKPPPAKGPPKPKPRPVEARRAAPRGNKPFSDPRLSPGENKTAEMMLNGHTYEEIADEMMTSVEVVRVQATRAQKKLGADVQLPRPGQGKRPLGTTKREAAFELFDQGLPSSLVAERIGMPRVNVSNYRGQWMKERAAARAPVASVEGSAYNPPAMSERPFEADYPQKDWPDGPPVDAQGRLTRDMDRRPLDQNSVIIGRNKVPGYGPKSEADRSLRDRIAVIQTLKKAGSTFERVPRSTDQTIGGWSPDFDANGRFTGRGSTQIADDLDRPITGLDDQEVIVLSHELAHSIDFKANPARDTSDFNDRKWGIEHKSPHMRPDIKAELESQLERIYRDLNNPVDGEVTIRTPKDRGYDPIDEDRELWAEAIRAYMYDPNYIKTVAPDVAFMIRDHVNRNSSLRKTIQFNAVPTVVGLGGLGLGAAALSSQPAEAQNR